MKHSDIDHTGLTGVGASDAADVSITDSGGYFTGTDVEAALQELGAGGGGGGGGATPDDGGTLVQSYNWASNSSGAASLGAAPTNGNLLILVAASNQHVLSSISQTGVTWTRIVRSQYSNGNIANLEFWKGVVGAGASASFTPSFAGNNQQYVTVFEYSGLTAVDAFLWSSGGGDTNARVPLPFPWKKPGGRALACMLNLAANDPSPAPSYWTARGSSPAAVGFGRAWVGDYDAEADAASGAIFLDHLDPVSSVQTNFWAQAAIHLVP